MIIKKVKNTAMYATLPNGIFNNYTNVGKVFFRALFSWLLFTCI